MDCILVKRMAVPLAELFTEWSVYSGFGNNPVNNVDPLGLDWFRNTSTGEEYWEDRTEANEGEEHLGAYHMVEGKSGYVLHHQNQVIGSYKMSLDGGVATEFENEPGSLSDKFFNTTFYGGLLFGSAENAIYSRNILTGTEIWHGKTTGAYYNSNIHNWGAYNGSRLHAMRQSSAFRLGSGALFGAGVLLTTSDVILNPTKRNLLFGAANITAGALATYGGPYGMVAGYGYFGLSSYTHFMINQVNTGKVRYNSNMMNNYVGGLAPTPLITN